MAWGGAGTLADRFDAARRCLLRWYPGRRRPGAAYAGFVAALRRRSGRLLKWVGHRAYRPSRGIPVGRADLARRGSHVAAPTRRLAVELRVKLLRLAERRN
jgi:hypothetical protein